MLTHRKLQLGTSSCSAMIARLPTSRVHKTLISASRAAAPGSASRSICWRGSTVRRSAMSFQNTVELTEDPILKNETLMWGVRIVSSTPLLGDSGTNLSFALVDRATDARTQAYDIDAWDAPFQIMIDGVKGWARKGTIAVPAGLKKPSALLVRKRDTASNAHSLDYITQVTLRSPFDGRHIFPVHSWVSSQQGERVFFDGTAYLPKDTPKQIEAERQAELKALRGEGGPSSLFRTYKYKVYDDLGKSDKSRPALGGSKALPYPRRLDIKAPGKDNLPYDEQFNFNKQTGFTGDSLAAVAVAFTQTTAASLGTEPAWYNVLPIAAVGIARRRLNIKTNPVFKRFEDVLTLFKPPNDNKPLDYDAAGEIDSVTAAKEIGLVKASAAGKSFEQQQEEKEDKQGGAPPSGGLGDFIKRALDTLLGDAKKDSTSVTDINSLLAYPEPKVLAGRGGMWATDLEFGRQVLAGMNPCMLAALKAMPAERGSAITAEHVDADLKQLDPEGRSMAALVAAAAAGEKPRLFIIDYWGLEGFWGDAPDAKDRCEHVGRCVMYLTQEGGRDSGLLPIAIELASRSTINGSQGVVYSRAALAGKGNKKEVLWHLAKAVFRSIDSGYHQLVSHWLRCHACTEPFLIALRRNMSILHPVTKLMLPHFRYTLNINCNARQSLINEGGTIETAFTPGAYALRLSSVAYKLWRFTHQALPTELNSRGMFGPEGLWLHDYPYAQDGLNLWGALLGYFTDYLGLYYSGDADVAGDSELQAWWRECKEEGHGDVTDVLADQLAAGGLDAAAAALAAEQQVWGFTGAIPSIDKLAWVLTTIAWTASGHHAAVNFGQYDYSSLLLNSSSMVRKPIPRPDAEDDKAYKALVGSSGDAQEGELLSYLADFTSALQVMTTVKLLSSHADDEHTLNEPNPMITDAAAVALNAKFIDRMEALEMLFLNRNRAPSYWTRVRGKDEALEYTLLYPSSKPGVTMRGVPYSVSI